MCSKLHQIGIWYTTKPSTPVQIKKKIYINLLSCLGVSCAQAIHTIPRNSEAYKINFVGNLDQIIPYTLIMPLKFTLLPIWRFSSKYRVLIEQCSLTESYRLERKVFIYMSFYVVSYFFSLL